MDPLALHAAIRPAARHRRRLERPLRLLLFSRQDLERLASGRIAAGL